MHLFLVQHGIAKSEAEDPERPLTEEGADAVRRMGAWAAGQGLVIDQIRHSGKRRAAEGWRYLPIGSDAQYMMQSASRALRTVR